MPNRNNQKNLDKIDYSQRHRSVEWRDRWFHLDRSKNDRQLEQIIEKALQQKQEQIKRQRQTAEHQAAYGPAGAGTPWFSIGPRNVNGRVKSIAVHPTSANIVYAGAANGGIWKSEDGTQSWRPLWDAQETLSIGSINIAISSPNTVYVGTGEWTPGYILTYPGAGVYVSTDGGSNWTRRASVVNRRIARVLVSPSNSLRVYVAGENGFERSTDGGISWTTIHTGQISDAIIDPNDANILYINVRNDGIYKSINGGDTWSLLNNGPTGGSADWIKFAIGKSGVDGSHFILAKRSGTIYRSTDSGSTWSTLSGSHGGVSHHEWANLLAVAPDNQDIILAGGLNMERTSNGGASWSFPSNLHADHHVAVFAPSNPNIVYTCNDGGVYRSEDKGSTWKKMSHGLIITQFYDVGSWNPISTVVGGGAQDTGTAMTGGGLTWRLIEATHDGGYFVISSTDPRTMYAEFQNTDILKSIDGGNTWVHKTSGLSYGTPWTGVIAMNQNDHNKVFVGTTRVFRTTDGCATPWVTSSQILAGEVSTISIAPSDGNRIYAGAGGRIYRSDDGGSTSPWTDKTTITLPSTRPIKDIAIDYTNPNRVTICYGGTNSGGTANHVFLSNAGGDSWTDISGNLPNISINAVALDPNSSNTLYVGTDVGVYRTTNLGVNWEAFDNGIPNAMISDIHIDPEDSMLYAATFGRGMYKLNIAPASSEPQVDLYLRDSILDVGKRFPSPSGLPNPNDVSDQVYWWESPDIKVDTTPYYTPDAVFDGVEFDEDLVHNDPKRTEVNRFYLQVHNRGWHSTSNVKVRAFFADAHAGLPSLPNALTPPDFNLTSTVDWTPIGPPRTISVLEPNRPVIVSWDWNIPSGANTHSCLLAVVSSNDDPLITPETNVNNLVTSEKRVCLKNLHVIDSGGPSPSQTLVEIKFHNVKDVNDIIDIVIDPTFFAGTIGMLFEPIEFINKNEYLYGVYKYSLRDGEDIGEWYTRPGTKEKVDHSKLWDKLDRSHLYEFDGTKTSEIKGIKIGPKQTLQAIISCKGSRKVPYDHNQKFTVMQRQGGEIVGGSTFEIRLKRVAALYPISHIRITVEKILLIDKKSYDVKDGKNLRLIAITSFNDDSCSCNIVQIPKNGYLKPEEWHNSYNIQLINNVCIYDGYVAEKDSVSISFITSYEGCNDADTEQTLYKLYINGPPEVWVGKYSPDNIPVNSYIENPSGLMIWYRIESIRL